MLFRRDIAYHGSSEPCNLGGSYCRSDVVVSRGNICGERAKCVEWCFVASAHLTVHILFNLVHWHMTGAFDDDLNIFLPSAQGEFAQYIEFKKLCFVVGIVYATWAHAVAKRNSHVVLTEDVANLIEMCIKEAFLVVKHTPFCDYAASARDAAGEAALQQVGVLL